MRKPKAIEADFAGMVDDAHRAVTVASLLEEAQSAAIEASLDANLKALLKLCAEPAEQVHVIGTLFGQLKATRAQFDRALAYSQAHPSMGHAKPSQ